MRVPAAVLTLPLLAGCVAGALLVDRLPERCSLLTAAASLLAVLSAAGSIADREETAIAALPIAALLAGSSLGLTAARTAYRAGVPLALGEPVIIEGRLREDATVWPSGVSLTLDVADGDIGIRLSVGGAGAIAQAGEWRAGRRLRLTALLRQPATYLNFGVPDEARGLARRRIALVGTVKSAALVEVVARGSVLDEAAAAARAWSRRTLAESIGRRDTRSAAVATAVLIGDRSGIPEDDERRLQEAGTYHVIAISGGNIAILAALMMFGLRLLRVSARLAPAFAIAALLFYGQITGAPPSVARAIAAAVVYLAARVLDHRGPPLNALGVAAAVAIAVDPLTPLDAGFVLSFGATLAILVGVPRLVAPVATHRRDEPKLARAVRRLAFAGAALLAATLCAEAALTPVGAFLFARVTFAGLLLNFAAIPLMTIVQVASLAVLAATLVSVRAAAAAGAVADLSVRGLVDSARLLDVAPFLSQNVPPPAWWLIGVYYACCVALLTMRRARRWAVGGLLIALLVILTSPAAAQRGAGVPLQTGLLRVMFLDVGQGDATLVQVPDGRSYLVDAGGIPGSSFDAGDRVVAPALRAAGVRRLESLVVTHGDPDHMGGAPAILRRFGPRAVWEGVPVPPHDGLRGLAELASARLATWRSVRAGDRERVGGVDLVVWHPPMPEWERQRVRNDDSIVLEIRYRDVSIVLTGDIEREAERLLAPQLALAPLVVLKAPHHGSATSSSEALITAAGPAAVVISAGRRNLFGHPHPAVLARYRAARIPIFRTDEDGAVMVETDGTRVDVRTYTGRTLTVAAPEPTR